MIPRTIGDIDEMVVEVRRQGREVAEIVDAHSAGHLRWRPEPNKWSLLGHVAHLSLVHGAYLGVLEATIHDAKRQGASEAIGPYRHPWIARWFARSMEPPPRRRLPTLKSMVPDPELQTGDVVNVFEGHQKTLALLIGDARGLDLGRIRFRSPLFRPLLLSLGTGFAVLLAHNRRHVWLMREVIAWDGFPGGPSTGG